MGEDSEISWTHHTFNPWRGCTKVSAGCANCYAKTMSGRNPAVLGTWGPRGSRTPAAESYWRLLAKWDREAKATGERRRVFVASLADVAERDETMPAESRPVVTAARARLWAEVEFREQLDFLLLTKRPDRLGELLAARWPDGLPPNIWAGTSIEDQSAADVRVPQLLEIPARVCFLSCEPLLGPVDLDGDPYGGPGGLRGGRAGFCGEEADYWTSRIGWVIAGGESGAHARPMHPTWTRSLRDQCVAAGVPFHFKQWGEWAPVTYYTARGIQHPTLPTFMDDAFEVHALEPAKFLEGPMLGRIGKHRAGRLLDGREWIEIPQLA